MPAKFTTKSPLVGKRVEIAPHYDLWMRGARHGVIHSVSVPRATLAAQPDLVRLKMDHPQVKRLIRVYLDDVKYV